MQKTKQKKKLKKLVLISLSILLVMQMSYTENASQLKSDSEQNYGIDLTKNYTGNEVKELIEIVISESEKAIDEAYAAGYKKGLLAYKPEVEYWKVKAENFSRALKQEKIKRWLYGLSGAGLGLIGGMGIGLSIRLSY